MAKDKCISLLVELEADLLALAHFLDVVDDAAGPAFDVKWTMPVRRLVDAARSRCEKASAAVTAK